MLGMLGWVLFSFERLLWVHSVPISHDFGHMYGWGGGGGGLRRVVPVGKVRILHVVVYGFQGTGSDPEKLAQTEHLFRAVLCEFHVIGQGHPQLTLGDFKCGIFLDPLSGQRALGQFLD